MTKQPTSANSRSISATPVSAKPVSPNPDRAILRADPPQFDPASLWNALSRTPGVGVSIMDTRGALLFVNDTSQVLFFDARDVDYHGKTIADFHPKGFVEERLEMIHRVVTEVRPLSLHHIYHGRRIRSTVWPIRDQQPPFDRVIVVSTGNLNDDDWPGDLPGKADSIETIRTEYIDLGPLNVLTRRELEVLALLGHGMSVPRAAAILHRSPKTIERHKSSIGDKLGLRGQSELVACVTAMGLDLSDAKLTRYAK